jgi:hypothetical protein
VVRREGGKDRGCQQTRLFTYIVCQDIHIWREEGGEIGTLSVRLSSSKLKSHTCTLATTTAGELTCEAGLPQEIPSESQSVSSSLGACAEG